MSNEVSKPRPSHDVIRNLVEELGQNGFSNENVNDLVVALSNEYPDNDAVMLLCDALGIDNNQEGPDESKLPWILFSLHDTAYGINSKHVLSIEILGEITPVVDTPHYCPGIVRSRGEMIELVDIRALFGLGDYHEAKSDSSDAVFMMIVTEVNEIKRGLIVDEILAVEYITRFEDGVVGGLTGAISSQYVHKIAKREKTDMPVLILHTDSLVSL